MSKTILLTPDQESTLKIISQSVATTGPFEIWYVPYAFKSLGDGLYERYLIKDAPEKIKDQLLKSVLNEEIK